MAEIRISEFRQRIERHLARKHVEVVCRKRNDAYNLVRADDQSLMAKLKPTGQGDEAEIFGGPVLAGARSANSVYRV